MRSRGGAKEGLVAAGVSHEHDVGADLIMRAKHWRWE